MYKFLTAVATILLLHSCADAPKKDLHSGIPAGEFTIYSKDVQDSFTISVQLPEAYSDSSKQHFDVVYVLDANFHFPMIATTIKQYEMGDLLPPLIVVGIGYKSFELMDSLRQRDLLYPKALPADEVTTSGGGKNFYQFITTQLISYIDSNYNTNKNNRSLLGHSLGGYFSLFALQNQAQNNSIYFNNIIAASPSLWYNNFSMSKLPELLKDKKDTAKLNIFISVGGLEDPKWDIAPVKNLAENFNNNKINNVQLQYRLYNELEHMDVAQISFIKGLQQFYTPPQSQ